MTVALLHHQSAVELIGEEQQNKIFGFLEIIAGVRQRTVTFGRSHLTLDTPMTRKKCLFSPKMVPVASAVFVDVWGRRMFK